MSYMDEKEKIPYRELIRNFIIEMVVYGGLVVIYFFIALRFLGEPLLKLFGEDLTVYAVLGLILIVAQAVLLEFVTSFLFDFLGLHRLTK